MKITLNYPVTLNGKTYESVTLRRAKGRDMDVLGRHIPALAPGGAMGPEINVMAATLELIASLSDTPREVVDEMDFEDITRIAENLSDFFPVMGEASGQAGAA